MAKPPLSCAMPMCARGVPSIRPSSPRYLSRIQPHRPLRADVRSFESTPYEFQEQSLAPPPSAGYRACRG